MKTYQLVPDLLTQLLKNLAVRIAETCGKKDPACKTYGIAYENDTFLMQPYCWCDKPDCPWCLGCRCEGYWDTPDKTYKPNARWVTEKLCDWCAGKTYGKEKGGLPGKGAPNFWHKHSGIRVWWYKYIGRGMDLYGPNNVSLMDIFQDCINSLGEKDA